MLRVSGVPRRCRTLALLSLLVAAVSLSTLPCVFSYSDGVSSIRWTSALPSNASPRPLAASTFAPTGTSPFAHPTAISVPGPLGHGPAWNSEGKVRGELRWEAPVGCNAVEFEAPDTINHAPDPSTEHGTTTPPRAVLRVSGLVPEAALQPDSTGEWLRACVEVTARSSPDLAWWFTTPPSAQRDPTTVICSAPLRRNPRAPLAPSTGGTETSITSAKVGEAAVGATTGARVTDSAPTTQTSGHSALVPFEATGAMALPAGFTRLSAVLQHPVRCDHPLTPDATSLVHVQLPTPGARLAARQSTTASQRVRLPAASELRARYERVRRAEAEEAAEQRAAIRSNAAAYAPLALHPHLRLGEAPATTTAASALRAPPVYKLLAPELAAALADGSPAALWSVLSGPDHTTPCLAPDHAHGHDLRMHPDCGSPDLPGVYTLPLFRDGVGEELLQEIEHAKASVVGPALSIPNNSGRPRDHRTGVILDEIALGPLAEALARDVLAPLSRLVYPRWAPWGVDSYFAFSIHVDRPGAERTEPVAGAAVGDSLPKHIDVCEFNLNVCLGRPGFNGSDVFFTDTVGVGAPPAGGSQSSFGGLHHGGDSAGGASTSRTREHRHRIVRHVPGRAFINLCQNFHGTDRLTRGERHALVVRALSSELRRSPAELYTSRCLMADTKRTT